MDKRLRRRVRETFLRVFVYIIHAREAGIIFADIPNGRVRGARYYVFGQEDFNYITFKYIWWLVRFGRLGDSSGRWLN